MNDSIYKCMAEEQTASMDYVHGAEWQSHLVHVGSPFPPQCLLGQVIVVPAECYEATRIKSALYTTSMV